MAVTRNATKKPSTKGKKKKKNSSKHKRLTKGDTKTKGSGNSSKQTTPAPAATDAATDAAPAATNTSVQDNPNQLQGDKIFACLHSNCIETFEVWQTARNHMKICKAVGDRHEGKPKIQESRKRGNQLIEEGKATMTVYPPMPTAEELATAIRDFHSNNKNMKTRGRGSLNDVSVIMRIVIKPRWGFALKEFSSLGYGTWEIFLDTHGICVVEDCIC